MKTAFKIIKPKSRSDFRRWLLENHQQRASVWVVIYKKSSSKANFSVSDVVEEALCFGWIDSVPNKIDSEKYKLLFSPRKPTSGWSAVNKKRVRKLIDLGLMTEHGLAKIKLAKKNGTWTKLNSSDRLEIPKELLVELNKNKKSKRLFPHVGAVFKTSHFRMD